MTTVLKINNENNLDFLKPLGIRYHPNCYVFSKTVGETNNDFVKTTKWAEGKTKNKLLYSSNEYFCVR